MHMKKVALITGGSLRIGKAIITELHDNGWRIIIHYRNSQKQAEQLEKRLNKKRAESAVCIGADLSSHEGINSLIQESIGAFKRMDLLVNNASSFYPTPVGNIEINGWNEIIGSNLMAPIFLVNGFREILEKSKGNIINITDANLNRVFTNHTVYIAAKAGLEKITQTLAKELAPHIRVNAVAPGAILPPPNKTWSKSTEEKIASAIPLNKIGKESDIVNAIMFLIKSEYITGQTITVDGGRSLNG